jgi:CheY-like chemotaxis protein
VPDSTPDALVGDGTRLQQVLLNVAGNAVKFTERGEIEMKVRTLSQDGEKIVLEFEVRDTGIGISQSEAGRVFNAFSQADASTTRRFGGTGLGLWIAQSLVVMMGGRIWVQSEVGRGSTFHFTIAAQLAAEPPAQAEESLFPSPLPPCKLRVLLVEDNPANQKLANYILQGRGHTVEIAGDGEQAIRMTQQSRYDAILMDVQMPGMDGLEVTAAIRAREGEGTHVPIIAMTAHAMKKDRDRCLAAGMDAYLSKPIDAREMIALIESRAGASSRENVASRAMQAPVTMLPKT